jgi:hypothetical protein
MKIIKCILSIEVVGSRQKLDIILENKLSQKLKLSKNAFYKKCGPRLIF